MLRLGFRGYSLVKLIGGTISGLLHGLRLILLFASLWVFFCQLMYEVAEIFSDC